MLIYVKNGMLRVHAHYEKGMNTRKVFELMNEGLILPPSKTITSFISDPDIWSAISKGLPCFTGTVTAYAEPGTEFGKSAMFSKESGALVYTDPSDGARYLFRINEEHLERKDALLLMNSPNYQIEFCGKDALIAPKEKRGYSLLESFPGKDGWYNVDDRHKMPYGHETTDIHRLDVKYLERIPGGRVGLVVCPCDCNGTYWNDIGIGSLPSENFGIVVRADHVAPKVERDEIVEVIPKTQRRNNLVRLLV